MGGAAIRVATAILALAASQPGLHDTREAAVDTSLQLARSTQRPRSHWSEDADDKGAELDRPIGEHKGPHLGGGSKTGAGSYSPQHARRFWSHYHSARPEPKEKPQEKQPRENK